MGEWRKNKKNTFFIGLDTCMFQVAETILEVSMSGINYLYFYWFQQMLFYWFQQMLGLIIRVIQDHFLVRNIIAQYYLLAECRI